MHIVKWAILLCVFWLMLSGFFQPLLLIFGVVSVLLVLLVIQRMDSADKEPAAIGTGHQILRYLTWLIGQIIISSLHVTKLVWGSASNLSPTLVKVSAKRVADSKHVLYANSITLTPGTLSVDLTPDELTVHALQASSVKDLDGGDMEQQITKIWKNA